MSRLAQLLPHIVPYAEFLVHATGLNVTSVYRSRAAQTKLYRKRLMVLAGRLPVSAQPFPVAPPGESLHEQRRAFDAVGSSDRLEWAGRTWISWGGRWSPLDPIHFEA